MHFHFPFTTASILWTLTFAAHLVLLVVLIGRERMARFPWFSASIGLIALRLLVVRLLMGRLPQVTLAGIVVVMLDVTAFVTLMVVVEMARRAFGRARRASWLAGALSLMAVGAVVLMLLGTVAAGENAGFVSHRCSCWNSWRRNWGFFRMWRRSASGCSLWLWVTAAGRDGGATRSASSSDSQRLRWRRLRWKRSGRPSRVRRLCMEWQSTTM